MVWRAAPQVRALGTGMRHKSLQGYCGRATYEDSDASQLCSVGQVGLCRSCIANICDCVSSITKSDSLSSFLVVWLKHWCWGSVAAGVAAAAVPGGSHEATAHHGPQWALLRFAQPVTAPQVGHVCCSCAGPAVVQRHCHHAPVHDWFGTAGYDVSFLWLWTQTVSYPAAAGYRSHTLS
jgi:hypothetical protein